jgi:methylenetetrahydrofolate dehydrogenase (NADP+)/methenyltetrahydrofolate cyclohydrolase
MTAQLIDGKMHAARLRDDLRPKIEAFRERAGRPPRLEVVLVGEHPASLAYVGSKARLAAEVGIAAEVRRLPQDAEQDDLLALVSRLNGAPEVDAILVQLPLPERIRTHAVLEAIDPAKDVDGFHPMNVGRLAAASLNDIGKRLVPCTPLGCLMLLHATLGAEGLSGRRAVVLGRSGIVGKPMAALLLASHCTVTIVHSRTRDPAAECRRAEILIAAAGHPGLVRGSWIAPGATVIDVGINRVSGADGGHRLVGDVAFDEAVEIAGAITPVPGGVGPMTVACLLHNTLTAACGRLGLDPSGLTQPEVAGPSQA